MPAVVESMAYAGQVPWHGLGEVVTDDISTADMLHRAGLDWDVAKLPVEVRTSTGNYPIPDRYALTRLTDNRVMSVVSGRYEPVQNEQLLDFFREYIEAGDATMETAGALYDGQTVWALANIGEAFSLRGNDEVYGYLLLANSHMPGTTLRIMMTNVRVVCANTLAAAENQSQGKPTMRLNHRRAFDEPMQQAAKQEMGIARHQLHAFKEAAQALERIQMTEAKAHKFLVNLIGSPENDETEQPRAVQKVLNLYEGAGMGSELPSARGTAWGLLNAVTEYYDHHHGRSPDSRLYSAWMGQNANVKSRAFEQLLQAA